MRGIRDVVREYASGARPMPPFDAAVGFRIERLGDGEAWLAYEADGRHDNPTGVLHGGVLTGLADSAMAFAYSTRLAPAAACTNVELGISFVRAVRAETLRAHARIVHAGRTMGRMECDIRDAKGELVARAGSTFLTLSTPPGAARAATSST